jgi:hypothetical protein
MLSLNAQSTLGLKTFNFRVGYDPAVLQATDVIEGDSLKRNNTPSNITKNIDQASGEIAIDLLGTGANVAASVATLMFEVIATAPETSVSINTVTASGVSGQPNSLAPPAPYVITVTE